MSQAEKYSWASLVTTGLIFWFFQMRMLDGWQVAEQTPGRLLVVYSTVVIVFIIAESVIAGFVAARGGKHDIEKDERDIAIEAKANRNASYFTMAALNIVVIQMLAGQVYTESRLSFFDLTSTASIFFVLFAVLISAHLVNLISTLIAYRA